METLLCKECCDESHHADIEKYYNSILNCLKTAACNNVPTSMIGFHKYWWSPELDDVKQKCIDIGADFMFLVPGQKAPRSVEMSTESRGWGMP